MQTSAHAKINLVLSVTPGARSDGLHAVETVICPLELADEVTVGLTDTPGILFSCEPDPLGTDEPPEHNVAWQAATRAAAAFDKPAACSIAITKHIPAQAGLGGGSSDAGAVLRCLARLWGIDHDDPRLYEVARSLGADVAYFLDEGFTLLTGVGDIAVEHFAPLRIPVVLVKPSAGVSTGDAYRLLDELRPAEIACRPLLDALCSGDPCALPFTCGNNMKRPAHILVPELDAVCAFLADRNGLLGEPLLCGSGSCMAVFVRTDDIADEVAQQARANGWWSCATRTFAL